MNTPGGFRCACPVGFTAPRCEVDINECASNPCYHDGTCLDDRGKFTCLCMDGKYLYIHSYVATYIHAYVHTHMHTYYMHTYVHTYIHIVRTCINIFMLMHIHIHLNVYVYIHNNTRICTYSFKHTYIHTCIMIYIHS